MNMLALTIILPLIGFVLLAFSRGRWSENVSAIVGVGSVGLAALVTAFIGDRKSTRLNSSHSAKSRMPSSA